MIIIKTKLLINSIGNGIGNVKNLILISVMPFQNNSQTT